jgi:hypothetical protein
VVEGLINGGPDSTNIKLSRTTTLAGTAMIAETRAMVSVLSDAGDKYVLKETSPGLYVYNGLNLPANKKYCLHITTQSGGEYQSDFVENEKTPAIDSVGLDLMPNGVQFYVNTHDSTNATRYYRWDYDETYTYFSVVGSAIYYKNQQVVPRPFDSLINECYKFVKPSNSIFVATSNKLTKDVIYRWPLSYIDASTGKISHVYSMLVKQYAISSDAYTYWTLLKKNTEQLGSIFDAQPNALTGNVHCLTKPGEPVIGYISASTIATKRIFVLGSNLPFHVPNQVPPPDTSECKSGAIYIEPMFTLRQRLEGILAGGDTLLTYYISNPATNKVIGYQYASSPCVDCRLTGGTTVKPSYWPF